MKRELLMGMVGGGGDGSIGNTHQIAAGLDRKIEVQIGFMRRYDPGYVELCFSPL